ncbi:MAG TPA: D-alanyl-D-alanine carboxypeptidase [Pseudonocardiaceae bacterium]|nr:D-alanyl-D-alanine carboxypeptidase [Pseudonocardiaceae bacterium]
MSLSDVPLAEVTVIGAFSGILDAAEPVTAWPESVRERPRDHVYRWLTLVMARLLLPVAAVATGGRRVRQRASEWALSLRFPSEKLAGLSEETRTALVTARTDAFWQDGELISVTSGRRGVRAQQRMFDAAIERYGSITEARHWVLPPSESAHVRGTAMDIRPFGGARWLERYGDHYGLYRTFDNEWWHFECLSEAESRRYRPLAS